MNRYGAGLIRPPLPVPPMAAVVLDFSGRAFHLDSLEG